MPSTKTQTRYASHNGLEMYDEVHGAATGVEVHPSVG